MSNIVAFFTGMIVVITILLSRGINLGAIAMLELKSRQFDKSVEETAQEASEIDLQQRVEELQRADRSLYNLMGMEVWAIAKTMDDLYPGFWHQFMENRRIACKQFMEQQKQAHRSLD